MGTWSVLAIAGGFASVAIVAIVAFFDYRVWLARQFLRILRLEPVPMFPYTQVNEHGNETGRRGLSVYPIHDAYIFFRRRGDDPETTDKYYAAQ